MTAVLSLPDSAISEAAFTTAIISAARYRGWLVHHSRPARKANGQWSTPLQGDAGLPDLIMVRAPRLIFAELKVGRNKVTTEQAKWLHALWNCDDETCATTLPEAYIWYPKDADRINEILA